MKLTSESNPILHRIRTWNIDPEDMLWAIRHGAERSNDKRSKQLQGAAQTGSARLKPYEGDWVVSGGHYIHAMPYRVALADILNHAERVLSRVVAFRQSRKNS